MEPLNRPTPEEIKAADTLPGAATDIADDEKVSPDAVDQYTRELNYNPHTDGE